MAKVLWLAYGLGLTIGVAACSVKRVAFTPSDGGLDDGSQIDDAMALPDAAAIDGPSIDAPSIDGPPPALGTMENPARACAELQIAGMPSAAYWVRDPGGTSPFEVYCEQQLNGGGWAMLENSVRRNDGTTTAFWQFKFDDRLKHFGTLAPDQNYYNGALYRIGTEYMDVFVDLQDKTAVVAVMTATGIDEVTMRFETPRFVDGDRRIYEQQFAAGWSALDRDGDDLEGDDVSEKNCAVFYSNVAQHYGTCWFYSLGSDAGEQPFFDGGVGPHVDNEVLTPLGLAIQPGGGRYSQVKRIARFTRW
jgi:hypothetical protein